MNCDQCEQTFAAAFEGCLDTDSSNRLSVHLATCPACRGAFEETRRLVTRLAGGGMAPETMEHSIADAVMNRIVREQALQLRRIEMMHRRIARVAAAAVFLAAIGGLSTTLLTQSGRKAYADDLKTASQALERAGTATWRTSYYMRFIDPVGDESKWVRVKNNDQRYYFKSPGLYRREDLDESGKARFVAIEDVANHASLELNPGEKVATLRYLAEPSYSPSGPFATFLGAMKQENLQGLGHREVEGRAADGYRFKFFSEGVNQNWSYEFWVDTKSKQLVSGQVPGGDIFDLSDVLRDKLWDPSMQAVEVGGATFKLATDLGIGNSSHLVHGVTIDVPLDNNLFSLRPPEGYTTKTVAAVDVAEKDVVEFLRALARYFNGVFPDRATDFLHGQEYQRFERIERDVLDKRGGTEAQIAFVEAMHKWWRAGLPGPGPLPMFIAKEAEAGSWKYLGDGVRLGDKGRVVCWYRPIGSKAYRIIFGDLSVKEVAPKDLPLPAVR